MLGLCLLNSGTLPYHIQKGQRLRILLLRSRRTPMMALNDQQPLGLETELPKRR